MIVFKTFFKILNKNKFIIILYTVMLLVFGGVNMQTEEQSLNFTESKPDIMIVNKDEDGKLTKSLVSYLTDHANIIESLDNDDKINDSLFYRETNYVIYIPKNYSSDLINNKDPKIEVKSTGDYQASIAEMLLNKYLSIAKSYLSINTDEDTLISSIDNTLNQEINVSITSKLDQSSISKAAFYFNFESYSLLACLIYVICLILSTFNSGKIRKRMLISNTDYKTVNRILFLSNFLYAFVVWLFYLIIGFIVIGDIMFSVHGVVFMINSFIFTLCATSIAFFISGIISNKEAINGVVNVVALGSSFLCGAFVPQSVLPENVLNIAHLLPTYYYIKNNELVSTLETIDLETLKPLLINAGFMIGFIIFFVLISNIVSKYKRHIA